MPNKRKIKTENQQMLKWINERKSKTRWLNWYYTNISICSKSNMKWWGGEFPICIFSIVVNVPLCSHSFIFMCGLWTCENGISCHTYNFPYCACLDYGEVCQLEKLQCLNKYFITDDTDTGLLCDGDHKNVRNSMKDWFWYLGRSQNNQMMRKSNFVPVKSTFKKCEIELKGISISICWCIVFKHLLKQLVFDFPSGLSHFEICKNASDGYFSAFCGTFVGGFLFISIWTFENLYIELDFHCWRFSGNFIWKLLFCICYFLLLSSSVVLLLPPFRLFICGFFH